MANACLLEAPGAHARTSPHVAIAGTGTGPTHVAPSDHAEAVDSDGGDESGIPKESCLKVCDDESNALVKLQTGSDLSQPGIVPCVSVVWNASASAVSTASQMDGLDPPIEGPPLRVRYSRLAL